MLLAAVALAPGAVGAAEPTSPGTPAELLQRPPPILPATPSLSPARDAAVEVPPAAPGARTLAVQAFRFTGNTVFDAATLGALVESYRNRPLSLAELYAAADAIGDHYVKQGYLLASAVVPAQNVNDGTVTIEVLEGYVESVKFTGLSSYRQQDLLYYLPEIEGRIYRGKDFERGLRDIDELPGLSGKAVLRPGRQYGTTEVVIETKEKRLEGEVFFDNSGRKAIGERRMAGQVTVNNPGGPGDSLTVLALRSTNDRLQYLYGNYGLPTGLGGTRFNLSYGYAKFDLADSFPGVEGENRTARAEFLVPAVRSAADRLTLNVAASNTKADTDLSGVTFSETDLTLLEVSGNYAHTWRSKAVTQAIVGVGSNFRSADDFNDGGDQLFRLETDFQHFQPIFYGLQVLSRFTFVYSPEPLPDTQAFALGGPASVRGYAPSEVRGDWGYFGSLTLRRPVQVFKAILAPRVFGDAGTVRSRVAGRGEASLSAVGIGTDFSYRALLGRLDYAIPLDGRDTSDDRDDGRVYGSVALSF